MSFHKDIIPPNNWSNISKDIKEFDVYKFVMNNYKDDETIFKVVKKDGAIKLLKKKDCDKGSKILASQIINNINRLGNDQVKIFAVLGASEESVILMLSSLLISAHHCICFEDLSNQAIFQRIKIFKPDIIICTKKNHEKLLTIINKYSNKNIPIKSIDLKNKNTLKNNFLEENFSYYTKNSNLFTLFTSGSTGTPKAVIHGVYDYLEYAKFSTNYFFGAKKDTIIFTATDAGWINGHTYAFYGPLMLGCTSVINENPHAIALPLLLAEILNKTKPDCFYTSVTVLRLLMSAVKPNQTISDYCQGSIKLERIGSCGEPLANIVGKWAINFFETKRKSIVNTYFQTETGGVLVAPRDEDIAPLDYSSVGKPRKELGLVIANEIITSSNLKKEGLDPNEILICNPWSGIFKKIISDKNSNYFTKAGYFRLHDIGYIDSKGYLFIGGRSDDVINVAGHRISSSELESTCLALDNINEVCAVAVSDKIYGSRVVLYFSSSQENEQFIKEIIVKLKKLIKEKLSKYHLPKKIYNFENLPKTKSGKIMRRIMRGIAETSSFDKSSDYSTLANKESFLESVKKLLK